MAEQTTEPRPRPDDVPPDTGENAGRLDNASPARLAAILVSLVLFSEIVPFQVTMISGIIPKIAQSFPAAGANVSWTITILGVTSGATMALTGKLADLVGKKKVLLGCGVLFLIGTLICAVTTSWPLFLFGRGIGAVSWGMAAIEYGIVRDLMPRKWVPICVGVIGTGFGLSSVIGPLIVGTLTDHYSWRSVFWFLAAYMIVTIPLCAFIMPESPVRAKQRLDIVGGLLFGASIGAALIYLSEGANWGWGTPTCYAYLIGGLVGLALFIVWELRVRDPIMELSLLRAPKVLIPMLIGLLTIAIANLVGFAQAYMFESPPGNQIKQQILQGVAAQAHAPVSAIAPFVQFQGDINYGYNFSVMQLALHMTIWLAVISMIFGPLSGYLARLIGARRPLLIGNILLLLACALWIPWHTTWQDQLSIGVPYAIGVGLYYGTNPNLLMDNVPAQRQGISAGMLTVFGGIGTSVSAALFTALQSSHPFRIVTSFPGTHPITSTIPQVYTNDAYTEAYIVLGVIPVAIAVVLTFILRTGRTPARGGEAVAAA